jgi:methylglutaconyl-CoA hydratase
VRAAKALIPTLIGQPLERRVELTVDELVRLRSSPEGQEGLSAFLEKRPASWVSK